jgi:L-alanine-DL-glutamate epimerase-like enolase superfamily enzyme
LTTDNGITGIGPLGIGYAVADALVNAMGTHIIGEDPINIEKIWFKIYHSGHRRCVEHALSVLSGIEVALWDIIGKELKLPIYKLLGGGFRDKVKVYASPSWKCSGPPKDFAEHVLTCVENGFDVVKLRGGFGFENAVEMFKTVRDAVGYNVHLAMDLNCGYGTYTAIKLIKKLERYEPLWIEEPIPLGCIDKYIELKKAVDTPIAAGEGHMVDELEDLILREAVDIIQPDVSIHGGLLKIKKICALAETMGMVVAPHAWSTQLNTAAAIHLAASTPNHLIQEFEVRTENEFIINPLKVKDGYVELPNKPGLGMEINEEALRKYPYEEYKYFSKEDLVKPIHGGEKPDEDFLHFSE